MVKRFKGQETRAVIHVLVKLICKRKQRVKLLPILSVVNNPFLFTDPRRGSALNDYT